MSDEHPKKEVADEVLNLLYTLATWSEVYAFLQEEGYEKNVNPNRESQSHRVLCQIFTYKVALFLYDRAYLKASPFTLRSLAKVFCYVDEEANNRFDENEVKSMEKKLKLLFERIECYRLINVYKDVHQGKRECLRIEATPKLICFLNKKHQTPITVMKE